MAVPRLLGRTLLAATAIVGAALTPAAAAETAVPVQNPAANMRAATVIHLSVEDGLQPDHYRTALLTCQPAGGTHTNADKACDSLSAANGNFKALRTGNENALCPLIYRPVTVTATGMWKNEAVSHQQTYPNACVLRAYTGPVFDF